MDGRSKRHPKQGGVAPSTTALKAACAELAPSTDQEQQLSEALQELPRDGFLAVRSSSPEEDLEGASFAGGYITTLGVSEDTLWDAIRANQISAITTLTTTSNCEQGE